MSISIRSGRRGGIGGSGTGERRRHTRIDGVLAQKFEDDIEYVAVVPNDFQYDGEEDISILDDDIMQEGDDD